METFSTKCNDKMKKEYISEVRRSLKTCSSLLGTDNKCNSLRKLSVDAPFGIDSDRYSSFINLIRITAWCSRFISRVRKETACSRTTLTSDELISVEKKWITHIQRKHFPDVYSDLATGNANNLQRQLGIFIRDVGILCCRGRLENADMCQGARKPILLPRRDILTK
ncbi:unnamed protein product [Mytilus coruscus]|uniref:Uncharacterized protein n=1 Tax=Mytilus coruscus TaxID=42192 RepID=A0A6J8C1N9_MYTCO|nr:unnamed protein product [Mytilus coruscus]